MGTITAYAFWKYDLCPFVLGGEVDEALDNGMVRLRGYGGGHITPMVILLGEHGRVTLELLNKLRAEYREEERELIEQYRSAARRLIGLNAAPAELKLSAAGEGGGLGNTNG